MSDRYTIHNLSVDIDRKLHSGGVADLQNFYSTVDEGRRNMFKFIAPPEMKRTAYIENALYDQVNKYAIAADVKSQLITDIKMLSGYRNLDTWERPLEQVYQRETDQKRRDNIFSVNYFNGVKSIDMYHPTGLRQCQHLLINDANSLSDNGFWNVGGNVVNLQLDKLNFVTGKGSLRFDINDSSTSGFIENFSFTPVNIYDYLQVGATFTWLDLPIPAEMLSVKLTLGSNTTDLSTDLYQCTVNQPHDNNIFSTGWNLLKFMLDNLTQVGYPNPRAIGYVRFDFETTGQPIPACHLDNVVVRKGVVYEMSYNSRWCIIDAPTQAWKKIATSNSDQLPFEEDTYQIFMLECAMAASKELYANNFGAASDIDDIKAELALAYKEYMQDHKIEIIEPMQHQNLYGRNAFGYYAVNGRYGIDEDHSPWPY